MADPTDDAASQAIQTAPPVPAQTAPPPPVPDNTSFSFAPVQAPSKQGAVHDAADMAWASAQQMGTGLVGAVSATARALGADPQTVSWIEQQRHALQDHIETTYAGMSPAGQKAAQATMWGGNDAQGQPLPTPGDVGWGRYIAANAAAAVPQVALAMLPGGIIGRTVSALAFGTIGAGDAYNHMVDTVDAASDQQMMTNPAYAQMRQSGMSMVEAKSHTVASQAPAFMLLHGAVDATAGAGVGGLLMKGAMGGAVKLAARAGLGAAEGAGVMGAQAGADNALEQKGDIATGAQTTFDPSELARNIAGGVLGGAAMGAAGGAMHGEPAVKAVPVVDSDTQAALTEALAPATKSDQTQPTVGLTSPSGTTAAPTQPDLLGGPARQPVTSTPTPPPATPEVTPAGQGELPLAPAPVAKMSRADLIDALATSGMKQQTLNRMSAADLQSRHDKLNPPPTTVVAPDQAQALSAAEPAQPASEATPIPAAALNPPEPAPVISQQPGETRQAAYDRQVREASEAAPVPDAEPVKPTVDQAAAQAAEPTPAQAAAGNYQKGHINVSGLDVSIETPKDGVRRGVGPDGVPWETTMPAHYGYIRKTEGADGDHLDVSLGPHADSADQHSVYVVDQIDPKTRTFDEHKAQVGFDTKASALAAYDGSFSDGSGPSRRGAVTEMPFDEFKEWAKSEDTTKPLSWKPTVGDTLRAKRAAEKAKMAAPGARVRGEATTVGAEDAPAPAAPEREARTLSEAVHDVHDAVQHAARDVTPINRKTEGVTERALRQALTEIDARIKGSQNEGDVVEAVARWGQTPGMIKDTLTRRSVIADRVVRLMTGKTLDEYTGRADAIRRGLAREPKPASVFESEGAVRGADREALHARDADGERQADLDRGGEGVSPEASSEGVADYGGIEEKPLAKGTTNLQAIGEHWLNRVLGGRATVHEAAEAYGEQVPGKRARMDANFSAYLDREIARANDPDATAALKARLEAQADPAIRHLKGQALAAATMRDNALMKRTGPEYAAHLMGLKAELDPIGEAVHANYSDAHRGLSVNKPIADTLRSAQAEGRTLTLHPLLRQIMASKDVRGEAAPLAGLARRLLEIAPDIDVLTPAQALSRGMELNHYSDYSVGKRAGQYTPPGAYGKSEGKAYIVVNPSTGTPVETTLHEALHSITSRYINTLTSASPEYKALDAIGQEVARVGYTSSESAMEIARTRYALTSMHELHTMLMSSPELQASMSRTRASPEFVARLRALGFDPGAGSRSVWQTFTNWVRQVLGISQKSGSILDQILRPIQDIADRAAEHNDNLLPEDRILRGYAEPLANMVTDAAHSVWDKVDPAGKGDGLRRMLLQGATTDGIVKWNKDLFTPSDRLAIKGNPLDKFRTAQEAIGRGFRDITEKYGDRVRDLTAKLRGADTSGLAKLMNDATIANIKLDTPDAPPELQARFDAMSTEDQAAYRATRDHYAETYRQERDAQLSAMVRATMPDATPDQVRTLTGSVRTQKGIDELIKGADDSDLAKAFGTAWTSQRAIVKGIAKVHRLGFVSGDYFPLRRFGDYVVRYGSAENSDYGVEMFEHRGQAEARRAELLTSGADDLSQVMDRRTSSLRTMMPDSGLAEEIHGAMKGRGLGDPDAVRDLVNSIILEHSTHSEAVRNSMRRRGVEGASTDAARVMAREHLSLGTRIGYLEHGGERSQALNDMRLVSDDLGRHGKPGEQIRAQAVLNELEKRTAAGDNSFGGVVSAMRRASTLGYVQSLMSPSHMLTSTIEAHMNSTSLLGARHGVGRAGLALTKALRDVSPRILAAGARNTIKAVGQGMKAADWNLAHLARDRLIAGGADRTNMNDLFGRMDAAGLIDHTMVREMQRIANPGVASSRVGRAWDKFLDFNAAGAHAVDVANKAAIAKAAYDLEMRKTGDHDVAAAYAIETVRQSSPNYNVGNKARITTDKGVLGGFAGPLTQFKQYGIHMYSVMANLVKASVHGATRDERMEARKAFAGILATHAMMAGVLTLIADPLRYVGGAYDFITGADKPHDYQTDVRGWMSDVFGKEAGELLARGAPHAAGIDIHARVGLGNLLEVPELKSFDKAGVMDMMAQAMTGAAGEDAATMAGGLSKMLHGDILGGLQAAVPRIVRDPLKAMGLADKGVTDSTGKTILPANKLSGGDVAAQTLGFQPARVSEFREGRFAVLQARDEAKSEKSKLSTAWLAADHTDRAGIMSDIRQFNMANPHERITVEQLMKSAQEQRVNARRSQATFGLTLPKKAAKDLAQSGRFADDD